jgi:parvulin-like peptidyl-prolyl isomerase
MRWVSDGAQCEKHAKKEEALAKLKAGAKFDDVAKEFSEDKARAGMFCLETMATD